ncbi:major capsid protein [Methylovulum psychrotolerans]|uniref:major capsid protein n=1 Tax=Methylovulum psychrotolerans TaxID=1704499 RepID=UPI001BFF0144|nr:major capsid protein [Methylovulum psychrotolerans]MBT9098404.1 major capsid protein [Methylovulum psychrotolerans]
MNIYSTGYMAMVIASLYTPSTWLSDRYFAIVKEFSTEEIHFDKIGKKRRAAPFVSPLIEGQLMESQGYTTDSFKPAYLKPKTPIIPGTALKRAAGEAIGGMLSPLDRMALLVANELQDHKEQIDLRLEIMAGEVLRTGKVTVSGDKYVTKVVDFGRDAALTVTLAGNYKWGGTSATPLANLRAWALLVLKKSGAQVRDVTMDPDAWERFYADPEVKEEIKLFRGTSTLSAQPIDEESGVFMGTVGGFNIFVYAGIGENDELIYPSGTVTMASSQFLGVRAFGAIQDEAAGLQAMAYFPKSWVVEDPSSRLVMTQSAPLMIPGRVNASFCATVL